MLLPPTLIMHPPTRCCPCAACSFVGFGWSPDHEAALAKVQGAADHFLPIFERALTHAFLTGDAACWADYQLLYALVRVHRIPHSTLITSLVRVPRIPHSTLMRHLRPHHSPPSSLTTSSLMTHHPHTTTLILIALITLITLVTHHSSLITPITLITYHSSLVTRHHHHHRHPYHPRHHHHPYHSSLITITAPFISHHPQQSHIVTSNHMTAMLAASIPHLRHWLTAVAVAAAPVSL